MNKKIVLFVILNIPVILALILWKISFSTIFVAITIWLIYILIRVKESEIKNKYLKSIYKIYKVIMMIFIISFISLEGCILININKNKSIDNVNNIDTIIVLGAKVNKNGVSKTLKIRLDKAIEYYKKDKDVNIIVSGGKGENEIITEAEAMRNYLLLHDVNKNNIIMENKATTTLENIVFSKKIIERQRLGNRVLIVTSDYHLFRGMFIAKILNLDNQGLCSISPTSSRLYYMIREYPTSVIDLYRSIKIKIIG